MLSLAVFLLGVLALEGVSRWVFKSPYQWDRRLMFYSENNNFRNTSWGGFLYKPHALVHTQTYYITRLDPPRLELEYEYDFSTNAQGLVQLNEVGSKPAILLLGDSFTEGQGARPWFYSVEQSWPPDAIHQIVNGGIVGTGVQAWGRLYRDLSTRVKIDKVVMIFISDDWTRPVWQFPEHALMCLAAARECAGPEDFYGLPQIPNQAKSTISRLAKYRVDSLERRQEGMNLLSRSSLYQHVIFPSVRRLRSYSRTGSLMSDRARQFEASKKVAGELVAKLGRDNVLFIYLPQKTELESGPGSYGRSATDFLAQQGFRMVDGRAECGLKLHDYHVHDGHPNQQGNAKIGVCVRRALEKAFRPL